MATAESDAMTDARRIAFVLMACTALALTACNRADQGRTTQAPPGVRDPTALTAPIVTASAPPAPAQRGDVPPNANVAAPGTDASAALAGVPKAGPLPPSKGGAHDAQAANVRAQEAAAKAPDTASADAAKKRVLAARRSEQGASGSGGATARDTAANHPRHGSLTQGEAATSMPKAGQANNHSSPALESESGRPSE